jgi:hypothetical protein
MTAIRSIADPTPVTQNPLGPSVAPQPTNHDCLSQDHPITHQAYSAIIVLATPSIFNPVAVADIEPIPGAVLPDRVLDEPGKGLRKRWIELPGIDPLGDGCNTIGAATGPVAGHAIQVGSLSLVVTPVPGKRRCRFPWQVTYYPFSTLDWAPEFRCRDTSSIDSIRRRGSAEGALGLRRVARVWTSLVRVHPVVSFGPSAGARKGCGSRHRDSACTSCSWRTAPSCTGTGYEITPRGASASFKELLRARSVTE